MGFPARAKWYSQSTNLSLRILTGVTSLIALCIFGWTNSRHEAGETELTDMGGPLVSPVIAGTAYTLAWSVIAVCVELLSHKPIHHGIYVTFDLFAWSGLIATIVLYMLFMFPYFDGGYRCAIDHDGCNGKMLANLEHFATSMACLTAVLYFWLFVRSCISTHKQRKGEGASAKERNDSHA
ncbi:hypothetical protein BDW42DRAFT_160602 [Aspergillus taichungensis]|uniref:MARVEL domain-containing protein n=1 Tax=Aspergillus taichungensis TaxID=482145 RepID=A0A2J5I6A4_9EURO|nr:hypothetical protein BDW42DRAFT_160602 [Aspergillus taichungensis]